MQFWVDDFPFFKVGYFRRLRRVCWMFPYPKTWILGSFLGDDFLTDSWDSSEKTTWGPTPKLPRSSRDFCNFGGLENPPKPPQKSHTGWLSRISSTLIGLQKKLWFVFWGLSGLHKCFFCVAHHVFVGVFDLVFANKKTTGRWRITLKKWGEDFTVKVVFLPCLCRRNTLVKIPPLTVASQADQWPIIRFRWTVLWCLDGPALRKRRIIPRTW